MRHYALKSLYVLLLTCFYSALNAQCWEVTSAGINHTLAVKADGTLWAWGFNGSGQLGDGLGANKAEPVQIGTATNWKSVSAGANHSLAIKTDGTLWAWGDNFWGQVGDGTFGNQKNIPIKIGVATNWKSVSAGRTFSLAIKTDGTLWAWGDNLDGQLGHQTVTFSPLQVGTGTDWKSVSAGGFYTLALKTNNTLWAWGNNTNGQLGDGTTVNQSVPKQLGTATDWNVISAGYNFTLALKTDGSLWSWGANDAGQLGNSTLNELHVPNKIGTSSWQSIETGNNSSLAIRSDGTLWAWGWVIGKFGFGIENTRNIPTQLGTSHWISIASGEFHALGFQNDGSLWSWGNNDWGELGSGLLEIREAPGILSAVTPLGDASQSFCQSGTVSDLKANGTGIKWYSTASGGSPLATSTAIISGNHYFASETRSGCESQARLDVTATINTTPTTSPTGPSSQSFCGVTRVASLVATGLNIKWYSTPAGGILLASTDFITSGIYYASQTIAACESPRIPVSVVVNFTPAPTGNSAQSLCGGSKISNLTITGTNPKWYANANSATALSADAKLVNGSTYYATQTIGSDESCQRFGVTVSLTNVPPPTGSAQQEICMQGNAFNLTASGENILWFGSATAENTIDYFAPLVNGQHYYAGQFVNGCFSEERLDVTVSINTIPAPTWNAEGPFCLSGTLASFHVTGNNIKWYDLYGGVTPLPLTTELINEKHYYASQTISGKESCLRVDVLALIRPDVAPQGYTEQAFCNQGKVNGLTTWSGNPITWYTSAYGTTPLSPTDALTSGHYFASQTIGTCETKQRLDVTVIVNTNPTPAPTGPASQFSCGGDLWTLEVNGSDIQWYASATDNTPLLSITKVVDGAHYFASQTVHACESADRLEIVTGAQPMTPTPEPFIADNWQSISSQIFANHNIGIKQDGTLWGWGNNAHGQLGNGDNANTIAYATLLNSESWKAVETGRTHTVAIKADGSLWEWGNEWAALSGGNDKPVPVKITSATNWSMISTGGYHNLALKTDGTLWTWGLNNHGQLGDGTQTDRTTPVQVGTENTWRFISAGLEVSYAIKTDGTLWGWGDDPTAIMNIYGNDQIVPVRIRETDNNWKMISAGLSLCLAVKTDGTLWAMGAFYINTGPGNLLPVQVGNDTNWENVSTGAEHAVGVKTDGTLWAVWGQNATGELGDSPFLDGYTTTPRQIGVASDWQFTEVGSNRSLLMKTDGTMWALGLNDLGQLSVMPEYDYSSWSDYYIKIPRLVESLKLSNDCQPRTVADLRAIGSQIKWYTEPYNGISLSSTTPLVHGKHYYASQTIGQCESPFRLKVTELNMNAPAPVGASTQSFCTASTVSNLNAFAPEVKWYNAATGGTLLSPSTPLVNGSHYYGTQIFNGCESSSRLDVTVSINSNPVGKPTGNTIQSLCAGSTLEQLIVSGTTMQWYSLPAGGSPLPVSTILVNNAHYYASQVTNACESSERLDVTAQIQSTTAPTLTSPATFCSGQQSTIASLVVSGTAVRWYSTPTGGSPLPVSTVLVDNAHYYASQTINTCESAQRLDVTAQVQTVMAPVFVSSPEFCSDDNATVANLVVNGTNVKWYDQAIGGSPLVTTTRLIDDKSYFSTQTVNGCESISRLKLTVALNPNPLPPTGSTAQSLELESHVNDIVVFGSQIRWYLSAADAQAGIHPIDAMQALVDGKTYFATQTTSGCESDALAVNVSLIITAIEPDGLVLEFYPNPVDNVLTISFSKMMDRITVIDLIGKPVMTKNINGGHAELNLSTLDFGVYFVQIKFNNKTISRKVIKM